MLVDVLNGCPRNALAFAALGAESCCVGLATIHDRLVAVCDWEGERVAVLLHERFLKNDPGLIGALTFTHLMTPEVIDAPPSLRAYFTDPMFTGCRAVVHEDEVAQADSHHDGRTSRS